MYTIDNPIIIVTISEYKGLKGRLGKTGAIYYINRGGGGWEEKP